MGMVNLANLGLEDYANDIVYNLTPTPCITLNRSEGKWISSVEKCTARQCEIKNFLNALIQECTEEPDFPGSLLLLISSLYMFSL